MGGCCGCGGVGSRTMSTTSTSSTTTGVQIWRYGPVWIIFNRMIFNICIMYHIHIQVVIPYVLFKHITELCGFVIYCWHLLDLMVFKFRGRLPSFGFRRFLGATVQQNSVEVSISPSFSWPIPSCQAIGFLKEFWFRGGNGGTLRICHLAKRMKLYGRRRIPIPLDPPPFRHS